jgi:hypothetical protein
VVDMEEGKHVYVILVKKAERKRLNGVDVCGRIAFFLMVYCFEVLSSTYRVYKLFRQPIYNSTSWIFSM